MICVSKEFSCSIEKEEGKDIGILSCFGKGDKKYRVNKSIIIKMPKLV